MMLRSGHFAQAYEVFVGDYDPAGQPDYEYVPASGHVPGTRICVDPFTGPSWTGSFAADASGERGVSGLFGTPGPEWLCVVQRGTPFLVNVLDPAQGSIVAVGGPVRVVEQLVEQFLLLLVTSWTITAVGVGVPLWTTSRIAIEEVRVDEVIDGVLFGVADPDAVEPRDFTVDQRTGEVVDGAGV